MAFPGLRPARDALLITDPNRLIGFGRLVTACFAIIAFQLDPTQPGRFRTEAEHVLALYLAFAVLLLVVPMRRPVDSPVHFLAHAADAATLGWLAFLTNELTSPFFSLLPYTLMAMTVRWGLVGAIAGAVLIEIVLFAIGIPDILDGESELNVLIIRAIYFLLSAIMLGYFGAYRESSRERLAQLANWPATAALGGQRAWLTELVRHACGVMGCRQMIVVWREHDRPDGTIAVWNGAGLELRTLDHSLMWDRFELEMPGSIDMIGGRVLSASEAEPFAPLLDQLGIPAVKARDFAVAAGFSGLRFRGTVLIADPHSRPEDTVTLCEIIAARTGSELERINLVTQHADNVRAEERHRLAQDLHDSVLQDLTATSLKLHTMGTSLQAAAPQLREVEELITEQQRRIRRFVEDHRDNEADMPIDLAEELRGQAELLQRKWGVAVRFDWEGEPVEVQRSLVDGLVQLSSEATSNAVRHGSASSVRMLGRLGADALQLRIVDNGSGLPPDADKDGSVSLRARVLQLGGSMRVANLASGLEVAMDIPIRGEAR